LANAFSPKDIRAAPMDRLSGVRQVGLGNARRKVGQYFSDNFYVTTSGHFHTRALFNAISELGVDRVMFSADYPYETMEEACAWFDTSLLCHNDALKIGRENARRLFESTIR
jgi:gamma-resorcylate decarboxylase